MKFQSGYIAQQAEQMAEQGSSINLINLDEQLDKIIQFIKDNGPLPAQEFMNIIGSHDANHFVNSMKFFSLEILGRCKANQYSSVLDLGCGCGRMALPICRFLGETGKYIGVDVWEDGIKWCQENIIGKPNQFEFFAVPSLNNYYFSDTISQEKNTYSLDFIPDQSIDIAFAISLFTHLRREDANSYFREIGRVLKPNGIAYVTAFIIDQYFFEYTQNTKNHTAVTESLTDKECFYAYSYQDFFAGFSMKVWNEMLQENGLWSLCYETGSWAEKLGARCYQDTFILAKMKNQELFI
jgi:ubiquinone/menaquinone biosynthesis C-methylase UbiE